MVFTRDVLLSLSNVHSFNSNTSLCEICPMDKAHKLPFKSKHQGALIPFELLYVDLWVSPVVVNTSAYYFLLLVDDHRKYHWIFFLNAKNDTKSVFITFHKMVECNFDTKTNSMQYDGGKSFLSIVPSNVGIVHHITCSHTSQ